MSYTLEEPTNLCVLKKMYLKDIAKNLNVSKTAVSLVLNNKGNENKISQETQRRIITYAKKHNYVPNQLARGLSRGKTETIGLIIPNISDTFYARIAGRIETKAMEIGYTVVFSSSNESPEKETRLIQSMLNRQVDGLIIASTQKNHKDIEMLLKSNFPLVLIDRMYPEIHTKYVVVDGYGGAYKAADYLISLGRKRIGFVTIRSELEAMEQRFLGYKKALEESNLAEKYTRGRVLTLGNYEVEMSEAIKDLISNDKVDALIFSTHYLTGAGLRALKFLKVEVPSEVAVISFDEMQAFDLIDPPITSIVQPVEDIGNQAVDILLDEIERKNVITDKKRILDTRLLIRKSCGA